MSAPSSAPPLPGAARHDMSLLVAGVAVSTAGDAAALTALSVHLSAGGAGWVAALLAAELVPVVVLAPITGRLVDRTENRRLAVLALTGQALVALPLALAGARWLSLLLFAVLSAFVAVVGPVTAAMIPAITGRGAAGRGYARIALGRGLGYIVGPAAGGLVTGAFGPRTALLADAASFAVLALVWSRVRSRRDPRLLAAAEAAARDAAEVTASDTGATAGGWRLMWDDTVLRSAVVLTGVSIAAAVVDNVAAPFRFVDQLRAGAGGFGTYLALWGLGALAGSQLTPHLGRVGPPTRLLAIGNMLSCIGVVGIGLAPGLGVAYLAAVAGGVGNGIANVALNAAVAQRVPAAAHGRAFAAVGAAIQTAVGLGTAAGAPLVALLQPDGAMIAAGTVGAVLAAGHVGLTLRRGGATALPHPARPDDHTPP